jgi:hypothetical protein
MALAHREIAMSKHLEKWFVPDDNPRGIKSATTGYYVPVTIESIRLMAAAPELLEALEELANTIEWSPMEIREEVLERIVAARSAIAKATGEA